MPLTISLQYLRRWGVKPSPLALLASALATRPQWIVKVKQKRVKLINRDWRLWPLHALVSCCSIVTHFFILSHQTCVYLFLCFVVLVLRESVRVIITSIRRACLTESRPTKNGEKPNARLVYGIAQSWFLKTGVSILRQTCVSNGNWYSSMNSWNVPFTRRFS